MSKIKIITFLIIFFTIVFAKIAFAESCIDDTIQKIIDDNRLKYNIPGIEVSISFPGEALPHDFVSGTTTLIGITRKFNSTAGEIWTHMGGTLGYVSNMIWIKCNDIVISTNVNNVQTDTVDSSALSNDLISYILRLDISKQCKANKTN